jgi:hypothetical protein
MPSSVRDVSFTPPVRWPALEFQEALERNRQRLAEQREQIKRQAAVQRGLTGPAASGKDTVQSRDRGRRR